MYVNVWFGIDGLRGIGVLTRVVKSRNAEYSVTALCPDYGTHIP